MKRIYLHVKRLFKKFWFFILLVFAISFPIGFALLIVMTAISMLFFSDPVDVDAILDNFSERELEVILSEEMDETVSDDDYLMLVARYQSYFCPKKVDSVTTWLGSEVTKEAFVYTYELKKKYEGFNEENMKSEILSKINKSSVHARRMVTSNRNMVFRYTYKNTGESFDIVITTEELKG